MKTKLSTTVLCSLMLLGLGCSSENEPNNGKEQHVNQEEQDVPKGEETEIYNKWKLVGFVDSASGVSITPEPNDNNNYWIAFNNDGTFLARSSTNDLVGEYQVDFSSSTISIRKIGGTKIGEILDGNLFVERLSSIQFFVSEKTSLKLYYNEKDYLLFKQIDENDALQGTKWKLEGIVNEQTGVMRVLEPTDCQQCYTLEFDTDTTGTCISTTNAGLTNLNHPPFISPLTEIGEISDDGYFFVNVLYLIKTYEHRDNTLTFFFRKEGVNYYLLYKKTSR